MEPANSPTLSTGTKVGKHRIQGISDEFIPSIMKLDKLDEIIAVDDGDAIIMAQKLSRQLGLGVGISSGANLIGALMVQEQMGRDAVVVTVFSDDNKKYLSTDLMREEPVKAGFLSADTELKGFRTFKRSCTVCNEREACLAQGCSTR
jgi:cysteine synthase A